MKYIILIFLNTAICIYAQDFDNYKPLKSTGKIPIDFTVVSSEAYREASGQISRDEKRFDRNTQKKFYLQNSFNLHELTYSGKLIYNDILTTYANKVLDEVLKADPQLRKELRLYVVKTPYVNAFATNNGMILINEGLIAQLETEAQLAFILCHEITHYTKKHVINQYVTKEKIRTGRSEEKFNKSSDKLFAINKYSKETEKEADQIGFELYKSSKYDLSELEGVFDVLEFAYLPFDEVTYENSFLEFDDYRFPKGYYKDSIKKMPYDEDEDDSHSTHPSISKRRAYIHRSVKSIDNSGRKKFVVSTKEDFLRIRKVARFELVDEYINTLKYSEALYCIYLLQKEEPTSKYLIHAKAKCIYAIAKYKNKNSFSSISTDFDDIYGESQRLHYLLDAIPSNEFNVYAVKYLWSASLKSSDPLFSSLVQDLMKDMIQNHYKDLSEFKTSFKKPTAVADTAGKSKTPSKYDKVKKKIVEAEIGEDYYTYAYVKELKDSAFVKKYNDIAKQVEKQAEYTTSKIYKAEQIKKQKTLKKKGFSLGIDKVVIASPFYMHIDERKRDQVRYLDSEEGEMRFLGMIKDNAQLNNLDVVLLDDIDVRGATTEKYNDYAFINNWFSLNSKNNKYEVDMVDINKEATQKFIEKHDTKYVCWMGTIAVRQRNNATSHILASLLLWYYAPFGIIKAVTPEYDVYFYTIVYDIETAQQVAVRYDAINRNDSKGQMNSIIYDTFYQINKK